MEKDRLPTGYWTKEQCKEEALKYNKRSEFGKNSKAYTYVVKNKWFNEICPHLKSNYRGKNFWTKERCQEEALKYNTRFEFEKGCISACLIARKNKWIDEICEHMSIIGNRENRCIYAAEFEDKHVYVGLTYNTKNRFADHLKDINSGIYKHIQKTGLIPMFKQLTDYIDVKEASKLEGEIAKDYSLNNWSLINKAKCGAVGGGMKWTKEKCIEESKYCRTRSEFKNKNRSAYNSALSHKWLNEIFENK